MESNRRLRAAVVGYGRYGRLHAAKYALHPDATLVAVVDPDPLHRREAARDFPVATHAALHTLGAVDIASVVAPATRHHDVARALLARNVHLLVEKPFTDSLQSARELFRLAAARGLVIQPGYLERFNLTLGELRARLPDPRYVESRRLTNWRGRGADVSVVLDLMIHDIDMLLEIVESSVIDIQARGVKVVTEHWDVANARLRFENGCVANLTASRASPAGERRLHVFSEDACALADIDAGEMLLHLRSEHEPGFMTARHFCRHEDPLAAEIDAFVHAVKNGSPPRVNVHDACRALAIAERIQDAMEPDANVLERAAMPLIDSEHAIAYLLNERPQPRGMH